MLKSATYQACPMKIIMLATFFLSGCQGAYFKTMEKLGYQKRELLVARVKERVRVRKKPRSNFNRLLKSLVLS